MADAELTPRRATVRWACRAPFATYEQRRVLIALAELADDDLTGTWPSLTELAGVTFLDRRDIPGAIRALAEAGHLTYAAHLTAEGDLTYEGTRYRLTPQLALWEVSR